MPKDMLLEEWSIEEIAADNARYLAAKGLEEGLAKGREEGRAKGREEGRLETARNLLAKGFPPETVSEVTGLDRETLRGLAGER